MSKYSTTMESKPPSIIIKYGRGETREQDKYTWGVCGQIPVAHLIGYITRVQAEIAFRNPEPCDECALVITFNPTTQKMSWFVDSTIPVDALVGTLEMLKQMLVGNQLAAVMQVNAQKQQTGLIGTDGQPILKRG